MIHMSESSKIKISREVQNVDATSVEKKDILLENAKVNEAI